MVDRSQILDTYQKWMADRWQRNRLTLDDIQALKVYAETHSLSVEEHEAIVDKVGVDRRELIDANNRPFADWLASRRQSLPPGSGSFRYQPSNKPSPWVKRLGNPPTTLQNILAGLAGILLIASIITTITVITLQFIQR